MIPRKIHYCWFGRKPLPESALKCIESWKKYLPDYEIVEWNEDNFDVSSVQYIKQAYETGKYAFVSDYARFWVLYNFGGLYFDTDVEVIRPMDDIIAEGPFMGCELSLSDAVNVAPGLGIGAVPGMEIFRELLKLYEGMSFFNPDGTLNKTTVVKITTDLLERDGFVPEDKMQRCYGLNIYPVEYFCPLHYRTGKCTITGNTRTIHHYAATWHDSKDRLAVLKRRIFSETQIIAISAFLDKFRGSKK